MFKKGVHCLRVSLWKRKRSDKKPWCLDYTIQVPGLLTLENCEHLPTDLTQGSLMGTGAIITKIVLLSLKGVREVLIVLSSAFYINFCEILPRFCSHFHMKGSRICHPKICFFGIRIILSWLFLRKSRKKKISENRVEVTFYKGIYTPRRERGVGWIGRLGLIYIHYWYYK